YGPLQMNETASLRVPRGANITAIDPVLFQTSVSPSNGWTAGARIGRILSPRASIEGSVEYSPGRLRLLKDVPAAIEATRASFVTAWTDLFSRDTATFQNTTVTATSTVQE